MQISRVAVHLVTYNHQNIIETCLEALLAQDIDVQICIVDNASTDNTVQIVQKMGLPVISNSVNVGYAVAHNQAIRSTESDYVLTLNPDMILQPGFIRAMVKALDENPDAGSAAGCLLRINAFGETPREIDSVGLYMRRNRRQGLMLDGEPVEKAPTEGRPIFGPDGAAAFYRRSMLNDIAIDGEFFDEDFFIHKEDVDICWRGLLRGWKSIYVPEAKGHHIRTFRPGKRQHVSSFLRICAVQNRYLLMLKNEVGELFRRDLLPILIYDIMIIGYLIVFETRSLKGVYSAWRLRKKIRKKRQHIQQNRKISIAELSQYFQ